MPIWKWSQTAATNATADSTINWSEGQAPSTINDSARAMMAALAKWRDDISLGTVTGGGGSAYSLTSSSGFDTLAHMNGALLAFVPNITNTGTPQTTLSVDGLAAQPIRSAPGVEIRPGDLQAGAFYLVQFLGSAFYLVNYNNTGLVPTGTLLATAGGSLPIGYFWCDGSAVSRTGFAALFNVISTFWGAGNGSTTFNLPNLSSAFPLGGATIPSTPGSASPSGFLTNTNVVGVAMSPVIVNWIIKY